MAAQQILFAETIMGMKKAMARKDDASESEDAITRTTNRGNKLKRKAKYVQEGRLDMADGPRIYRRKIDYNGYSRHIINRNPLRVDADGDVVDDDDSDSLPDLSDAEENPYADIRLEELLMPLTSAAKLDKHPSLAVAYTNKILEEMIQNAREMLEREQTALYKMKKLMVEFRGDVTWIPCGDMQTDQDTILLGPQRLAAIAQASTNAFGPNWENMSTALTMTDMEDEMDMDMDGLQENGNSVLGAPVESPPHDAYDGIPRVEDDELMCTDLQKLHEEDQLKQAPKDEDTNVSESTKAQNGGDRSQSNRDEQTEKGASTTQAPQERPETKADSQERLDEDTTAPFTNNITQEQDTDTNPPHRMTTRARAQAPDTEDLTSPTSLRTTTRLSPAPSIPSIHPFFLVPPSTLPSRDFNLPYNEASDSRRLLSSYIQKQEEVCRGAARLYTGLQKALRLRKTVWMWCRAEGHVGEMSDGEDWYDCEEWGLEEGLKKGEEAEEEEVVTGKKTRNRRVVA